MFCEQKNNFQNLIIGCFTLFENCVDPDQNFQNLIIGCFTLFENCVDPDQLASFEAN